MQQIHPQGEEGAARPPVALGIVLCAGGSRRMGRPKGLLEVGGASVLAHHLRVLGEVCRAVCVVIGSEAAAHRGALPGHVVVVENPRWDRTGPIDSLRLALRALDARGPCLVAPVDTPPARPAVLRALLAAGAPAVPVGPDGRAGHPVLLDGDLVARIRAEAPKGGLRTLLDAARRVPVDDPIVGWDFDDPEAWERFTGAWAPG